MQQPGPSFRRRFRATMTKKITEFQKIWGGMLLLRGPYDIRPIVLRVYNAGSRTLGKGGWWHWRGG